MIPLQWPHTNTHLRNNEHGTCVLAPLQTWAIEERERGECRGERERYIKITRMKKKLQSMVVTGNGIEVKELQ